MPRSARSALAAADPRARFDGFVLALAALATYVLLGQDKLYKVDGHYLLLQSLGGELRHPFHPLYLPGLAALHAVLAPFGLSAYRIGVLYSALGTALGVGLMHGAARVLGMNRAAAAAVATLVATAPAIVFFATVVEVHGPFLAFAGAAALAAAWLRRRPTFTAAAVLGASTAVAALAHATGHLLPFVLLPVAFGLPAPPSRTRTAALITVTLAAHAVCSALLPLGLAAFGLTGSAGRSFAGLLAYLRESWRTSSPLATLVNEWLWPFLPLSLAWLAGARDRRLAAGLLLALVVYLTAAMALLGGDREFGAYLLPLAWPAALLTVRAAERLPHRSPPLAAFAPFALAAAGLCLGVVHVLRHDQPQRALAFAAGVREVAGSSQPFLLIGGHDELEACLVAMPDVPFKMLLEEAKTDPAQLPVLLPWFDRWVEQLLARGPVLLTEGGAEHLRRPQFTPTGPSGPLLLEHLQTAFRLEPVAAGEFRGWRVLVR